MDSPQSEGSTVIVFAPEASGVEFALAALCDVELAVDITLRDGSLIGGVLAEVVSGYLSLRGFNDGTAQHTDDLTLIPIEDISRVVVP